MTRRLGSVLFLLVWVPVAALSEDRFFESNGVKIRYVVEGQGEPVLFIHGFSADLERNWVGPRLFSTLAKSYRTIAYDNRGHGKSEKPHDPMQYGKELVEDAVRLLDHLDVKRAHVVGYSMGAAIVTKLLIDHPDRLLSATLGGNAGKLEGADFTFYDQLADDLEAGKGATRLFMALRPPGEPPQPEEQLKAINTAFIAMNDQQALTAVIRGVRQWAVPEAPLMANKVPVLALIGSLDPLKREVDALSSRLAGMNTVVIEGANHMTAISRPEFATELLNFLEKHHTN
ncbi:MAG: alpha/beta hydrolase [Planctomycetota bacterium]|nr:alpha/beta hydrolase [Planctomycetota bacterium]